MQIHAAIVQFPVTMDIPRNLRSLRAALECLPAHTLVVGPEGTLSGYLPHPGFVDAIDLAALENGIGEVRRLAIRRQLHVLCGACLRVGDEWRNSTLYFGPEDRGWRYDKINLATSERGTFRAGDALPVWDITIAGQDLRLGVQMCREIRYPEQWRVIATKGAQVIAYVNNAVGSTSGHSVWRAHVISRAAETQRFVLGANNAAPDQTCPSLIVSPAGTVLAEMAIGVEGYAEADLEIGDVSDWVLKQTRDDVVRVSSAD